MALTKTCLPKGGLEGSGCGRAKGTWTYSNNYNNNNNDNPLNVWVTLFTICSKLCD